MLPQFPLALTGAVGFAYGQAALVMWGEWSAASWFVLGTALLPLYALPWLWQRRRRGSALDAAWRLTPVWLAAGSFAVILYLEERPPRAVLLHPDLTATEQAQVRAECEFEAVQRVGSSHRFEFERGRREYVAACLAAQGFRLGVERERPAPAEPEF